MNIINNTNSPTQITSMAKFLTDRGWVFSGNCGCAANESRWLHPDHVGWRLKTRGSNTQMTFEQQQDPRNTNAFKPVLHANAQNYTMEYERMFPKTNNTDDATQEISK